MPRSREHEKRPVAGREKMPICKKTHISIVIYNVPLRDVDVGDVRSRG